MKSQVSVEYLAIISISLLLLIPFIIYGNLSLITSKDELRVSMAKNTVERLGEAADWVYSQGYPAKITLMLYIPEGVEQINLTDRTINFRVRTSAGPTDVFYVTKANLVGSIPLTQGYVTVSVKSQDNFVNISVTS